MTVDEKFMQLALREARRGLGHTSPNPAVGAVIIARGKILARGFHRAAGQPHAEIEALRALKDPRLARGATLYVTLEPCSTQGRTPPCVDAIIAANLQRVVIGALDPNPVHAGRGVKLLRRAKIKTVIGVLEADCTELNAAFNKWIVTKIPFVIAKAGLSLDGRITRPPAEGRWITSEASRAHAQRLRTNVDAILIGAATLRADDPQLTVRGVPGAKQPWRIILSRSGKLPRTARVFTDELRAKTIVYSGKTLRAILRDLGRREITSVLIEGGARVLGEAFDRRLVDRAHFYIAPLLVGGPKAGIGGRGVGSTAQAPRIANPHYERIDDDLLLTGNLKYEAS